MTVTTAFEWFLYACANLLPQLTLITIACRDFLRFSMKKTIILSSAILLWYFGCLVASEVNILSYFMFNVVVNIGYVAFGVLLTKGKPWQLLFALGMVLNYGSVCAIISGGFFHALHLEAFEFGWQDSLLTLCIAAVFGILYYKLLVGRLRPLFNHEDSGDIWRILWLVPALFCIIHYFCMWSQGGEFSHNIFNVVFLIILNFGSAFVSYLVAKMVDERTRMLGLEAENQRLAMQTAQYESLKGRMEETRQARHDLRQHLRLMQSYLDSKNETALREYMKEYGQTLPADNGIRYSENTVTDTVVRYYAELAQALEISFDARMEFPAELNLPDPDLCVILGNLLENALDSCKKHQSEAPYIRMGGKLVGTQMLTIIVDNCPADQPKWKNDMIISTKRNTAGTGTASIRSIAKRYDGEARFEWKDKIFSASVVINLPENKAK